MHELALVEGIMEIVGSKLEEHNLSRLTYIKLKVGQYSGAFPEALRFAFESIIADTVHREAVMDIENIIAKAECKICGKVFLYQVGLACPHCGGISSRLIEGEELLIDFIEAE